MYLIKNVRSLHIPNNDPQQVPLAYRFFFFFNMEIIQTYACI